MVPWASIGWGKESQDPFSLLLPRSLGAQAMRAFMLSSAQTHACLVAFQEIKPEMKKR